MRRARVFSIVSIAGLLALYPVMFMWSFGQTSLADVTHYWIKSATTTRQNGTADTKRMGQILQHLDRSPAWTGNRYSDPEIPAGEPEIDAIATNEAVLFSFLRQNKINVTDGVSLRREIPETEAERRLLAMPHVSSLPDKSKSQVLIISRQDAYHVGDKLRLRVDLYDRRGRIRTTGGDEVRIWLTSRKSSATLTSQSGSAVAARVTDLRNGSYLGEAVLKWPGLTYVRVSLVYPREFFRVLVALRHSLHSMRWVTAIFNNRNGTTEITGCLPSFPVPGFPRTCNLTSLNSDIPWYCGHPTKPRLTCSHWTETSNLAYTPLAVSASERLMVNEIDRGPFRPLVPNNIVIPVQQPQEPEKDLPPCWSQPRRDSWETPPTPMGWFDRASWRHSSCSLPEPGPQRARLCMRNTTLVLTGDSNMHMFYKGVLSLVKLTCNNSDQAPQDDHVSLKCWIPELNAAVHFVRHAMPFNVGRHENLAAIPQPRPLEYLHQRQHHDLVVVIHYYVHMSFYPLAAFRDRVRATRQAVERLLHIFPKAKVFIRGPHVIYDGKGNHAAFGDSFGLAYTQIWKNEFRGLFNKLWFLDYWDMTIASENFTSHPPDRTVLAMLKVLFGYFCER